jgi:hypothetical protein
VQQRTVCPFALVTSRKPVFHAYSDCDPCHCVKFIGYIHVLILLNTSRSLVQRYPTDCGASLCVIKKPRERGGHSQRWAAEPEKTIIIIIIIIISC